MKKTFAFITVLAFVGVSAFTLNKMDKEGTRTSENKTECATSSAEKAPDCCSSSNAVLTSGTEKASPCGPASNAVLTSGTEKASPCGPADKAEKTAGSEKATGCGSTCGSGAAEQTASSGDCSTEKAENERVAEIQ